MALIKRTLDKAIEHKAREVARYLASQIYKYIHPLIHMDNNLKLFNKDQVNNKNRDWNSALQLKNAFKQDLLDTVFAILGGDVLGILSKVNSIQSKEIKLLYPQLTEAVNMLENVVFTLIEKWLEEQALLDEDKQKNIKSIIKRILNNEVSKGKNLGVKGLASIGKLIEYLFNKETEPELNEVLAGTKTSFTVKSDDDHDKSDVVEDLVKQFNNTAQLEEIISSLISKLYSMDSHWFFRLIYQEIVTHKDKSGELVYFNKLQAVWVKLFEFGPLSQLTEKERNASIGSLNLLRVVLSPIPNIIAEVERDKAIQILQILEKMNGWIDDPRHCAEEVNPELKKIQDWGKEKKITLELRYINRDYFISILSAKTAKTAYNKKANIRTTLREIQEKIYDDISKLTKDERSSVIQALEEIQGATDDTIADVLTEAMPVLEKIKVWANDPLNNLTEKEKNQANEILGKTEGWINNPNSFSEEQKARFKRGLNKIHGWLRIGCPSGSSSNVVTASSDVEMMEVDLVASPVLAPKPKPSSSTSEKKKNKKSTEKESGSESTTFESDDDSTNNPGMLTRQGKQAERNSAAARNRPQYIAGSGPSSMRYLNELSKNNQSSDYDPNNSFTRDNSQQIDDDASQGATSTGLALQDSEKENVLATQEDFTEPPNGAVPQGASSKNNLHSTPYRGSFLNDNSDSPNTSVIVNVNERDVSTPHSLTSKDEDKSSDYDDSQMPSQQEEDALLAEEDESINQESEEEKTAPSPEIPLQDHNQICLESRDTTNTPNGLGADDVVGNNTNPVQADASFNSTFFNTTTQGENNMKPVQRRKRGSLTKQTQLVDLTLNLGQLEYSHTDYLIFQRNIIEDLFTYEIKKIDLDSKEFLEEYSAEDIPAFKVYNRGVAAYNLGIEQGIKNVKGAEQIEEAKKLFRDVNDAKIIEAQYAFAQIVFKQRIKDKYINDQMKLCNIQTVEAIDELFQENDQLPITIDTLYNAQIKKHFGDLAKNLWDENQVLPIRRHREPAENQDQWIKTKQKELTNSDKGKKWREAEKEKFLKSAMQDVSDAYAYLSDAILHNGPAEEYPFLSIHVRYMLGIIKLYDLDKAAERTVFLAKDSRHLLEIPLIQNASLDELSLRLINRTGCLIALDNLYSTPLQSSELYKIQTINAQKASLNLIVLSKDVDEIIYKESLYRIAIIELNSKLTSSPTKENLGVSSLKKAAIKGHVGAKALFGTLLFRKEYTSLVENGTINIIDCINYLKESAIAEYAQSEYLLGVLHYKAVNGIIPKDVQKSFDYLTLAKNHQYFSANQGSAANYDPTLQLDALLETVGRELDIKRHQELVNKMQADHINTQKMDEIMHQLTQKMAATGCKLRDIPVTAMEGSMKDIVQTFGFSPTYGYFA